MSFWGCKCRGTFKCLPAQGLLVGLPVANLPHIQASGVQNQAGWGKKNSASDAGGLDQLPGVSCLSLNFVDVPNFAIHIKHAPAVHEDLEVDLEEDWK